MDQLQLQEISEDDKEGKSRHCYNSVEKENEETVSNKKLKFCQPYYGILLATLAMFCALTADVIARKLSHYRTSELIAYHVMIEIIIIIPILIQQGIKFDFWFEAPLLIFRGTLLSMTFFFRMFAVQSLKSLIESLAIIHSYPIITSILGRIFLKYRFTNVMISALITNIIGLIFVSHFWTGLDTERLLGLGSAFSYAIFFSAALIILKKLTFDMEPKLVVFHTKWMRLLIMISVTEFNNNFSIPLIPKCNNFFESEAILLFLMGIAMLGNAIFEAEAVKLENPSIVSAVKSSTSLPIIIAMQIIAFNDIPSIVVVIGVVLVLVSSLLINFDGIVEKLALESPLRRIVNRINNS